MIRTIIAAGLAALVATTVTIQSAEAGPSTELSAKRKRIAQDANGNVSSPCVVVSKKTGARARVGCAHVATFQAYIDELETNPGTEIRFMGGIRPGKCWSGGMHPCGKALDVCQLGWGRVDSRCHLPGKAQLAAIAKRHGLFEGGLWCRSDYGHAQVGVSAGACGTKYASRQKEPWPRTLAHHNPAAY